MWFSNISNTKKVAQAQKMARSLKIWIQIEEQYCYPCSENKGSNQNRSLCWFSHDKVDLVFSITC